jgi:predicted Zn-dependent peptidase
MSERMFIKELPSGMVLVGQEMEHVSSAAMTLVTPAGASHEAEGKEGAAAVVTEWSMRGAGDRDTRALNDALDALGCQHHEDTRGRFICFEAVQLGRNVADILAVYADVLRRARLEDRTFGPCRDLALQDLASLEDEPARKCTVMLRERFYPHPLGRSALGKAESLAALTPDDARRHSHTRIKPDGTILSVAGNVEWNALAGLAERLFGDWSGEADAEIDVRPAAGGVTHVAKQTAQTHIALAYPSVPIGHERYYAARLAETVLSGGMSGRLFTEVREKRGLVYHVAAHYHSLKDRAGIFAYAGTRPETAQETFDVLVAELRRLAEGIEPDELARARTQLKSALVMQGESTAARSAALASDWYHLGRLRSLRELSDAIDGVNMEDVTAYLCLCPPRDITVLVVGPEPIDTGAINE